MADCLKTNAVRLILLGTALLFAGACGESPKGPDELYLGFQEPPSSSRPFVRWWWNGNRVTAKETLRELDVLSAAGIGGVEMNAIAMPVVEGDPEAIAPALNWLSPEWNQVVKATAEGARERRMIADLIIGSGWPFGGRFLNDGEKLQLVTVLKEKVRGPAKYSKPLAELTHGTFRTWDPVHREEVTEGSRPELWFLRLVPVSAQTVETGTELVESAVRGDRVEFDVPGGEYWLYAGSWREGFRTVELGAPGADGPVVDHFNREAVQRYLQRVSGELGPALGGQLGDHFRAVFCDSLELGEANWTGDFAEQFKERRRYDPIPWLHYMTDPEQPKDDDPAADLKRRLRYDFNLTIAELFQDRFIKTLVEWAHANGVKARVQAYGRETHPLDASLDVDLPEGETWIWGREKTPYPTAANRYVASAAHLTGKRVVSAESMTNTSTIFQTLPYQLKQTGDLNYLSGINHFILHGFSYSPPEAGFPGWVRFGAYFNEKNTWWPYMRKWTDYAARVSWVLQNSEAQASVAILSADADVWSDYGRPYHPFPEREAPGFSWRLWESLHRAGYNADYISDRILTESDVEGGVLDFKGRRYGVIILPGLKRMTPASARQLLLYAREGGRLLFIERMPQQGPSYKDIGPGDTAVRLAMEELVKEFPDTVRQVEAPPEGPATTWAAEVMEKSGIGPDVRFAPPSDVVSQIHQRAGERDIYFIVHSGLDQNVEFAAEFPGTADRTAWRWDPETGGRQLLPPADDSGRFHFNLGPLESVLLVFEPEAPEGSWAVWERPAEKGDPITLVPEWKLHFTHGVTGEEWDQKAEELFDLGAAEDPKLQNFAGTIVYRAEIEPEGTDWNWIDLGTVHGVSELWLNGQQVGVRWYGRHAFPIQGLLKSGANQLEVRVTTHLGNYVRSLKDNAAAQRWAGWFPIEPAGLIGPVSLK